MPGRLWTPDEDAVLLRMLGEGASDAEIAGALGINKRRVRNRRLRLGLDSPVAPGRQRRVDYAVIWRRVRVGGESRAAVARDVGLSKWHVARIALGPA